MPSQDHAAPAVPVQKLKGDGAREPLAVERMNTPELEEEKRCGPRNRGLEAIKVSELGCGVARGGWSHRSQTGHCVCSPGPGEGAEEFSGSEAGDH